MKSVWKAVIVGAIIIAIGIITVVITLALNGWTVSADWETKTYESENDVSTVKIDYSAGGISTRFYDGEKLKIEYPETDRYTVTVGEENGVLNITSGKRHWYDIGLWGVNIPSATVYIPNGKAVNLELTLNAGKINIAKGGYADIDVTVNAGTVTAQIVTCSSFDCKINAGSATINGMTCTGKTNCEVNAGSIEFCDFVCNEIDADINAGSLRLDIRGERAEYTINAERSAGSISGASNQTGTKPDKKLDLNVSAGSVDVTFTGTPS